MVCKVNYKWAKIADVQKSLRSIVQKGIDNIDTDNRQESFSREAINNFKENSSISFVYKNNIEKHRKLTPIVQNLKLNYILKDDLSL